MVESTVAFPSTLVLSMYILCDLFNMQAMKSDREEAWGRDWKVDSWKCCTSSSFKVWFSTTNDADSQPKSRSLTAWLWLCRHTSRAIAAMRPALWLGLTRLATWGLEAGPRTALHAHLFGPKRSTAEGSNRQEHPRQVFMWLDGLILLHNCKTSAQAVANGD